MSKDKTKKKNPVGPPVQHEVTDKMISQVEYMAGLGMKTEDIAAVLGMARSTLWKKFTESERLSDAIKRGNAKAAMEVTQSAYKQAVSGKNTAMTIFWLKVRQGWKEPIKIEQETKVTFETQIGKGGALRQFVIGDEDEG